MITRKNEQTTEVREKMRGGEGAVRIRHYLPKEAFGAKCRLCAELTLAPGASIGLHDHAGEDEVFIIQSGSGAVIDNGVETAVAAGDAIVTGRGASHSIRNTSGADLVVTAVIMQY